MTFVTRITMWDTSSPWGSPNSCRGDYSRRGFTCLILFHLINSLNGGNAQPTNCLRADDPLWITKSELQTLITILRTDGYCVVAPTVEQDAIVYAEIESREQLPHWLWTIHRSQESTVCSDRGRFFFAFNVGPHSWKQFLFPPRLTVGTAERGRIGNSRRTKICNRNMLCWACARAN